jgi:hypothetical protein
MNADPDNLKDIIDQLSIPDNEKKVLFQMLGKMEKELKALNFKLERALKDKKTLSTLLSHFQHYSHTHPKILKNHPSLSRKCSAAISPPR